MNIDENKEPKSKSQLSGLGSSSADQYHISTRWASHSKSTVKRSTTKKILSFFPNRLLSWLHANREPWNKTEKNL